MKRASVVSSHMSAFVEANAAFARLGREGVLNEEDLAGVKKEFASDWADYLQIGLTQPFLNRASDLAEAFALRAYDSVHLAAAEFLVGNADEPVTFACFDMRLNRAAKVLGFELLEEES
jgi:predicted nucleic acid-binding protein